MADFSPEVLDALVKGKSKEEIFGPDGLLKQITGALVNRLLESALCANDCETPHPPEI